MLQEIVIKSNADKSIKPLVETAIRNQLKALQHGIMRTKKRIAEFEEKAGITSEEFEANIKAGTIVETLDTIDWNMELSALKLLEGQYKSLSEAKID